MEAIKPFAAHESKRVSELLSGDVDASISSLSAPHLYPTGCPSTPVAILQLQGPPPLKRKRREEICPDAGAITYLQRAWRKRMATLGDSSVAESPFTALLRAPVLTSDLFENIAACTTTTSCGSEEEDDIPLR